jgi:hypothetical protein
VSENPIFVTIVGNQEKTPVVHVFKVNLFGINKEQIKLSGSKSALSTQLEMRKLKYGTVLWIAVASS